MKKLIIFLLIIYVAFPVFCATRFYLPSSGTAESSPAFDATWEVYSSALRLRCQTVKTNTAMTSFGAAYRPIVNKSDCLCVQYVSDPLLPQIISGTVSGDALAAEASNFCNSFTSVVIKVVSDNGYNVRGILVNSVVGANNFANGTLANRFIPAVRTVNVVTAESRDRIVIEMGFNRDVRAANTWMQLGDNAAADIVANETGTAANNPWVDFSQNIKFYNSASGAAIIID